ncbi:hypothetical protein MHN80_23470 [Gordonia McavH-238-E]|nr:hypothetical protein [Gordonia sp. McavH-238-E]
MVKALIPAPLKAAAKQKADDQGMDLNSYIQTLIARDVGSHAAESPAIQEVLFKRAV